MIMNSEDKDIPITILALDIDGVLTDGRVLYTSDGQEQKYISFRDIDAIFKAHRCGLKVALVTGEDTPWVQSIVHRLQVEHVIQGAKDKLEAVRSLAKQLKKTLAAICYIGDSDRDAPALAAVGLGIAPANATAKARAAADLVLQSDGGYGVVHEALEYILEQRINTPNRPHQGESKAVTPGKLDINVCSQQVRDLIVESIAVQHSVADKLTPSIVKVADILATSIIDGHKLLIFGNGGSAADAQHMASEFIGRFEINRKPLAAIALTTDTSLLTSVSNDYGHDAIFSRQIEALGENGDIAIAISTSGSSENVLEGVRSARKLGIQTIGMTGRTGGKLAMLVDLCLCVPSTNTARIQEAHGLIIHLLCKLVEENVVLLANRNSPSLKAEGDKC